MKQSVLDLETRVKALLGEQIVDSKIELDEYTIEVSPDNAFEALKTLRDEANFEQLMDLCGVDYLGFGDANWETLKAANTGFSRGVFDFAADENSATESDQEKRFAVVYHLLSVENNLRIRVKVFPTDVAMPTVDSVIDLWSVANWFEREAFDLYGIIFNNHPDLRRILTDYGFVGHPLRKDFPLTGNVEMRYDSEKGRVVYEPVSIENRVNVPRVVRDKVVEG